MHGQVQSHPTGDYLFRRASSCAGSSFGGCGLYLPDAPGDPPARAWKLPCLWHDAGTGAPCAGAGRCRHQHCPRQPVKERLSGNRQGPILTTQTVRNMRQQLAFAFVHAPLGIPLGRRPALLLHRATSVADDCRTGHEPALCFRDYQCAQAERYGQPRWP